MGLDADVLPHFGGALGNVFTYGAAGVTLRIGSGLEDDFGPPRIRPSLPGSAYFLPGKGFNWYLFAGLEGRAVLYNIFLDGNTFTDSHSVDKSLSWAISRQGWFSSGIAFGSPTPRYSAPRNLTARTTGTSSVRSASPTSSNVSRFQVPPNAQTLKRMLRMSPSWTGNPCLPGGRALFP